MIFREGEAGDCAYIIEDGSVEICVATQSGEQVVTQIGKGELFGEIALIDYKPRMATVRAIEKVVLIPIHRKLISELLGKNRPHCASLSATGHGAFPREWFVTTRSARTQGN